MSQPRVIDLRRPSSAYASAVLVAVLGVVVLLARHSRFDLSPDEISYLEIARRYADGDVAVRGYWSPLLIWLGAPLIALGVAPVTALQVIVVAASLAGVAVVGLLAGRLGLAPLVRLVPMLAAGLIVASVADVLSGDVIGTVLALVYLLVVLDARVTGMPVRWGLLTGVVITLAYYARSFNAVFIAAHLPLHLLWLWCGRRRLRPILTFAGAAGVATLICVAPWLVALHHRYGTWTISTAAQHTRGLVAPDTGGRWIACMDGAVLCTEPDDVLFVWEDHLPSLQPNYDWSPFSSGRYARHQIELVVDNLRYIANINGTLYGVVLVGNVVGLCLCWRQRETRRTLLWLLGTTLVYLAGYLPTLATGGLRYFLLPTILSATTAVLTVRALWPSPGRAWTTATVARVGAVALPVSLMAFLITPDVARPLLQVATGDDPRGRCRFDDAPAAAAAIVAPFALVEPGQARRDAFHLSYQSQLRTLGYLDDDRFSSVEIAAAVRAAGVRTLLVEDGGTTAADLTAAGFAETGRATYCGQGFAVLSVP